ncbi:hypothetical protein NDI76_17950 [Halogeometricum sp. S1BR25-6]|uniref:Transporter n=1 Tax=Halogeometricum salsisoli TaxID=2950536 RepID=A0ABU2GIJ5_9EURY|nr:hypothetical protein [Halogeometricum sp. S1BR25-6]MDS0300637.1 hypothetical protein [Halogeometricum sp. S1BR25-6]
MTDASFVDVLCDFRNQFRLLAMVSALALVVLAVALQFVESGTATYVISVVQIVTFVIIFIVSGTLLVVCTRRQT